MKLAWLTDLHLEFVRDVKTLEALASEESGGRSGFAAWRRLETKPPPTLAGGCRKSRHLSATAESVSHISACSSLAFSFRHPGQS